MFHNVTLVFKLGILSFTTEGFLFLRLVLFLYRMETYPRHLNRIVIKGTVCLTPGPILLFDLIDEAPNRNPLDTPLSVFIFVPGFVDVASRHDSKLTRRCLGCGSSGCLGIVAGLIGLVAKCHRIVFMQCLDGLFEIRICREVYTNIHCVASFFNDLGPSLR